MMPARPIFLLALSLLLLVSAAHATTGGPSTIKPLGYDARDQKIFFLEEGGGEGPFLQVVFLRLGDDRRLRPRRARSWHFPDGDESDPAVKKRLQRLRRRLRPLRRLPRKTVNLRVLHRKRKRCRLRVTGEWERVRCVRTRAKLSWAGRSRAIEVTSVRSDLRLVAVYEVPDTPHRVALIEHSGLLVEGGYIEQLPLLLLQARSP